MFSYDLAMVGSDLSVIDPKIDDIIGCVVSGLPKSWKPTKTWAIGPVPGVPSTYTVTGADFESTFDALQNLYLSKYIGDGEVCSPATKTRVDWLLTGTDHARTDIIGKENGKDGAIETGNRILTFEAAAVQMAMTGGRPEYLCVIEAAMQNGMQPLTTGQSSPNLESSSGASPMIILNGKVADEIRVCNGFGLVAPNPKWPAGRTIARSCWMIRQNLGNMLSGKGTIGVYGLTRPGWCWAENEEGLPPGWTNFAEDYYGRKKGDDSVTQGQCFGMGFNNMDCRGTYTDPVIKSIVDPMESASCQLRVLNTGVLADSKGSIRLVLIPGQILRFMASNGWDKAKTKADLAKYQQQVLADVDNLTKVAAAYKSAGKDVTTEDKLKKYNLCTDPTTIRIIACGGDHLVADFINCFQSFGNTMVTRSKNWSALLAAALKDLGPYPDIGAYHNDL